MRSLNFSGDAKRYGVTAANRTEAEKIEIASGEKRPGKAAKVAFRIALARSRLLQPVVINAIQVYDFRLQAFGLKHGGKTQDADRRKLAHDARCFRFAHGTAIELVGCGRTDETNFHGCHLFGLRINVSAISGSFSIN